jgi:hypothetical protein
MAVPTDIAGLRLWLKSDTGVYSDAGVTLATNGQGVQEWHDQSGNGNHATQSTPGNRPVLVTSAINSLPAIDFDDAGPQYFDLGGPMSGATAGSIFVVIKVNNDPPNAQIRSGLWDFSATDFNTHYPFTDSVVYDGWGATVRKTVGDVTPSLSSTYRIYNVTSGSADWRARLDGLVVFTTTSNTVTFRASGTKLGQSNSALYCLDGRVAELFAFDSVLSDSDRFDMFDYLNTRYALGLADPRDQRVTRANVAAAFQGATARITQAAVATAFAGEHARITRSAVAIAFVPGVQVTVSGVLTQAGIRTVGSDAELAAAVAAGTTPVRVWFLN